MEEMVNAQEMGNYNVDIALVIDGTASMRPIIEEVKRNALSFNEKFLAAMEREGKSVSEVRVKVIVFRDFACDSKPLEESEFFKLPEDNERFHAFVSGIEAIGGGDVPENALEAIATAIKSDWTTGGRKRRHAVLLFTDAPALALGDRADSPNYPQGMPKDLAELGDWWEGNDQSFESTYQSNAGRLVVFAPNAYPWEDLQTWNRYWPAFSKAGSGLEDVDIQAAIDLLVGSC